MSLLWSLQPPTGPGSWLFGTMHVRDDRVYQLCKGLYPRISQCDAYIGEMDLDEGPSIRQPAPYQMRQHFRPHVYQKMRGQILKSFLLDLDRYTHLHPLMIMSAISHRVMQSDHAVSLDEHLWSFARDQHKSPRGLESAEEQLNLLHSIDPAPVYNQLRQISRRPQDVRRFTDKVLQCYLNEDIHQLYRKTKSSLLRLRKTILYSRNHLMTDRIEALDKERRYFIAVGAGHLSGRFGLISQMRRFGWDVRAVSLKRDDLMIP